jgi:hypothetical protein
MRRVAEALGDREPEGPILRVDGHPDAAIGARRGHGLRIHGVVEVGQEAESREAPGRRALDGGQGRQVVGPSGPDRRHARRVAVSGRAAHAA